jgi:hypothetical protein
MDFKRRIYKMIRTYLREFYERVENEAPIIYKGEGLELPGQQYFDWLEENMYKFLKKEGGLIP